MVAAVGVYRPLATDGQSAIAIKVCIVGSSSMEPTCKECKVSLTEASRAQRRLLCKDCFRRVNAESMARAQEDPNKRLLKELRKRYKWERKGKTPPPLRADELRPEDVGRILHAWGGRSVSGYGESWTLTLVLLDEGGDLEPSNVVPVTRFELAQGALEHVLDETVRAKAAKIARSEGFISRT